MYWVSGGMEGVYCVSFDGDWERGETWHKMCHRHMSVLSTVHDNWHNNKKKSLKRAFAFVWEDTTTVLIQA